MRAAWLSAHRRTSHGIPADMDRPECGKATEADSLREVVAFRHRHALSAGYRPGRRGLTG